MTTRDDLVKELRWPTGVKSPDLIPSMTVTRIAAADMLQADASALEAKDAEIARLKDGWNDCISDLTAAQKRISDLERQLAEETESNQWRPIETAPRDGTQFLAALSNGWTAILNEVHGWDRYAWYQGGEGNIPVARTHKADGLTDSILATHWRPLPSSPIAAAIRGGAK